MNDAPLKPERRSPLPGIALIVLGGILMLPAITGVRGRDLWPVFVLGPGLFFLAMFLMNRRKIGLLMPGTVMTVTGLLFFYCTFAGWERMHELWPFFLIAPGVGFILMFLHCKSERGLLIPGGILTILGALFLTGVSESAYIVPALLIIIGLMFLLWPRR
jgi:uncharacterized membrane protein HdeD (DUF308 family)